jgi:hypothetical protein
MFDSLNAAIDYLEDLKNSLGTTGQYRVSVTVTPSIQVPFSQSINSPPEGPSGLAVADLLANQPGHQSR